MTNNPSHHHSRSHHNWRKSKTQDHDRPHHIAHSASAASSNKNNNGSPFSLLDLSAKIVAEHIPFQLIENRYEHIPEPVQRRIIYWSFPRHEDDIRMYSSLSGDNSTSNSLANNNNNNNNQLNSNTSTSSNHNNNTNLNNTNNNTSNQHSSVTNNGNATSGVQWIENSNHASSSSHSGLPTNSSKSNQHNRQLTFYKGLRLYNENCVHDVLQVGFNLTGTVSIKINTSNQPTSSSKSRSNNSNNHHSNNNNIVPANLHNDVLNQPILPSNDPGGPAKDALFIKTYRVSVTFDRCKITSVSCSCESQDIFWCEHVVALILFRIRNPETIDLRVPISETLLSLDRHQLQKLVQYIIAEHHTEVLPTAQRLLDEMRQSYSQINQIQGAPDPTAGASADDAHIWHLDEFQVNEKVQLYLNSVCVNSKDAVKQINALFEKIREMFRAKDSNGIRLLKLITEQFLLYATRNEKPRPLWDQLVSLWVVVLLNPDITKIDKRKFIHLLLNWSKVSKCPKEDIERRISYKRKAPDVSDDDEADEYPINQFGVSNGSQDYQPTYSQSNNYPAHMATHGHRAFQNNSSFPVLRPYNQVPILPSACPYQLSHSIAKKLRSHQAQHNNDQLSLVEGPFNQHNHRASSSSSNAHQSNHRVNASLSPIENHLATQEPRSVFYRALDFEDVKWNDPHLQLILHKDGPADFDSTHKSTNFDFTGNPLWNESISQAAARVETLKSHGYQHQALRLTVATVRRLKLQQDQWCLAVTSDSNAELPCQIKGYDNYAEGWIGHPFDPVNVLMDILLEASLTESNSLNISAPPTPAVQCSVNMNRCSCPIYTQALADFTHRLLPDLSSLSYQHRLDGFPLLPPLVNLAPRRSQPTTTTTATTTPHQTSSDKNTYHHVPVPSCCRKDSYLTLGVEVALIALGQQRAIPTTGTAHDRAVRQESDIISKLESIDTSDPILIDTLKHQTTLLLEGGPFQNHCCGVPTDSAPLHTYARYLFDSLVTHYPQLAYKVGVYALKMPLLSDDNGENFGAARTSPRSINLNHLQSEQLALAQTMLSKAKDEGHQSGCLRKVYRASVKNIRNPASLLKLSKHVLKEAKPSGTTLYPALLKTSFDLGLQVLKITLSPHTSNGKTRREAISFIIECATDIGLEAVLQVMKDSRDYFSAIEALNLVITRDNEHVNLRSQALSKLKLKDAPIREVELNRRSRELLLDCANRDPTNCALEALRFCEGEDDALKRALKIVMDAGASGAMDSTQLIKVADHISDRGLVDKAFEVALVAVDSLSIPSNSDNSSSKKDIFSACEYAQKVNGFSTLIPKLINNIECATVLSDIYHRFCPSVLMPPRWNRGYGADVLAAYRNNLGYGKEYELLNSLNPEIYKQSVEDARWWDTLLKRTIKAFVDTTRTRLQNISPRHYGEFIGFLIKAQGTFDKSSEGPQQFKDLILEIMKSYKTKKKLMERLKARFDYSIKTNTM